MNERRANRLQWFLVVLFGATLITVGFGGIHVLICFVFEPTHSALVGEASAASVSNQHVTLRWAAFAVIVIAGLAVYSSILLATMVIGPMLVAKGLRRKMPNRELRDVLAPFARVPVSGPMFDRALGRLLCSDVSRRD